MAIKAVLFDFSGTLFRVESTASWLRAALTARGVALPPDEEARLALALDRAGALPGGSPTPDAPGHLADLVARRDESAELHRAAYTGLARTVPLPDPGLYDALYDRHMTPEAWQPYPDALDVLRSLRGRGVRVGVVSNIGWNPRPVFRAHGLDPYVNAYVLSYEHGVQKPDPRLFAHGCDALAVDPADTLMVGDDRRADGGAAALGCAVHFVPHLPVSRRPDALRPVLALAAVGGTAGPA
ncbi:HAD family hydrolase [Streptomyces spectabilis]|uniref:HAD family hydrolase n=1 Tax=Streptomyces spectabilis TaxID=68270 RepID=A0A5P2XJA3_STRST|nr:HAD-IA family hydrolase [Streptomyces spectabilis]MBB5101895.1 putative hydrolase of the HAD superfamily [Streptomyces spectabilis]MCI3906947.1 HAD-IA family hydrolase [Streptomyces spectabilis]QEV63734.1 HAD family hydrolase [Streptomyces spectabilis]GGV34919.1 hydrolase [Streptomyces spectabilis]